MIVRVSSCVGLLFLIIASGCGSRTTHTVQIPPEQLPEIRESVPVEESQSPGVAASDEETVRSETEDVFTENLEGTFPIAEWEKNIVPAQEESVKPLTESPLPEDSIESEEKGPAEEAVDTEGMQDEDMNQNFLDSALALVNASQEYWAEGNQDKALSILDEAYTLFARVDTDSHPELIQQKEDLRYMISKRVLEIYASRYTATNGYHNEIPLTLNEYVEKEIKQFQGPERRFFIESYQRSGKYMPMILESLKEAGLPEDLAWIPLIESGFKVNALSRARALGLWQFIASTGQKFGLKRDTWVDERLDAEKSTAAAIAYLKELHQIFGDWTTVLAGYNCGEGTVLKKIRSQQINYLDNFWDLFQMLPYETARYVPRFLATLHILKDPAKYGFELGEPQIAIAYETVTIKKPVQLKAVAKAIGATEQELTDLNPELRQNATPPTAYALRIPEGKTESFIAGIDSVPKYTPPQNSYVYHSVRKGETLSDIAVKYRTSVSKIVAANNIREKDFIRIGQRLKVPLRGAAVTSPPVASRDELQPGDKYQVQKGDSLWLIAKKFNTDTKKIQQVNGLSNTQLQVGQILIIPGGSQ